MRTGPGTDSTCVYKLTRLPAAYACCSTPQTHQMAECENKMLAKTQELDRALSQRAQEHAEALMRASAHHQRLMRQVEEQLLARNMELEAALNKQALEQDANLAQRIAAHGVELEKAKSRGDAAQEELRRSTQEHADELERLRGELTTRVKMCAVLDADKQQAEVEVDTLTRQLADARDKLKSERAARSRDQEAMVEERDRREADADSLHKRCLQSLRAEMQRAASSFGAEREALQAEVQSLQMQLAEAQASSLAAAAQARSAALQARLAEQEKKELEEVLKDVDASMPAVAAAARQRQREEDEARVQAMVDDVRKTSEERVGRAESTLHAALEDLRRQLASVQASAMAGVPAAAGARPHAQPQELEAALQREAAALARAEALAKERDSLKAERERILALPNPCGVGVKLKVGDGGITAGAAGGERGVGWLVVEQLVPGMAAHNCGVVALHDRILAVDGEKFEQVLLVLGGTVVACCMRVCVRVCVLVRARARVRARSADLEHVRNVCTTCAQRAASPLSLYQGGEEMVQKASKMLLGKRGSKVRLTLQQVGGRGHGQAPAPGGASGGGRRVMELTLKRGAWGAEHAVVEEERADMADLGRWPTPV